MQVQSIDLWRISLHPILMVNFDAVTLHDSVRRFLAIV